LIGRVCAGAGDFHQLKKNTMPVAQTLEKSAGIICEAWCLHRTDGAGSRCGARLFRHAVVF
jgi:hypothetical protein